jgi:hypothetical protein
MWDRNCHQIRVTCLVNAAVSMGRRNTELEHTLYWKQKLKSLARHRPTGTLPWVGFDRVQPNRWFSRGSIAESKHWMLLHRPVELAAVTGEVKLEQGRLSASETSGVKAYPAES